MAHEEGHTGSARDTDPATLGSSEGSGGEGNGSGFLGGFPSGFQITTPNTSRWEGGPWRRSSSGWFGHVPTPAESVFAENETFTLDELRQVGRGGYVPTDVWGPQNEEPGTIAQLQALLVEGGLLNEDDLTSPGYYDDDTKDAYRDLLTRANAWGTSWEDALTRLRSNPSARLASQGKAKTQAGPVARVSNPDDLRSVFKSVARRTLGSGNIGDEVLDRMVSAYQGLETKAQTQPSGVVTDPPSAETFADDQLHRLDPVAYDANKVIEGLRLVMDILGGKKV